MIAPSPSTVHKWRPLRIHHHQQHHHAVFHLTSSFVRNRGWWWLCCDCVFNCVRWIITNNSIIVKQFNYHITNQIFVEWRQRSSHLAPSFSGCRRGRLFVAIQGSVSIIHKFPKDCSNQQGTSLVWSWMSCRRLPWTRMMIPTDYLCM